MLLKVAYLSMIRRRLRRLLVDAQRARDVQHRILLQKIKRHANSDFGRTYGFAAIRSAGDFRKHMPVLTYDDHLPYMTRVLHGETTALFAPGTRILMFAMTSGTTGEPKRLPITEELFREYRAGWRLWGAGVFGDHRELLSSKTLQLSSDWRRYSSPTGVPCGQISGLAAETRPKVVAEQIFMPSSVVGRIHDTSAKHYTTLRLALASERVRMIVTANPSTLIELARRAGQHSESLVRDICDGTLSCDVPTEVRAALMRDISRRQPTRARHLERLIEQHGSLLPKYAWPDLSVLAVWTGGSVGVFTPKLFDLYGMAAVRDHGLSASEGRITIPLADGTSTGLLDFCHHYFEFIPVEERDSASPVVLEAHELEVGREYFVLLTSSGGLYRYDIHDVVRCTGFEGQAPYLEFLNKGKNFSSIVGEKLSEYQVIEAVQRSFRELKLAIDSFTLAPLLKEKPRYVLLLEPHVLCDRAAELQSSLQANLERVNEEYQEKCASERLLPVQIGIVPDGTWQTMRRSKTDARGNYEEYKHPCLVNDLSFAARLNVIYPSIPPVSRQSVSSLSGTSTMNASTR